MTPSIPVSAATLIALLCAVPALSQQRPIPSDTLPDYVLEGVIVTATRTPALRHELPQTVEVVSRSDLERTPGHDLAEALKENAGLDVIQYPGLLSGVSIRGFRPQFSGIGQRTLVLLDGRPAGVTNLATLDLAGVERIEVLKGPASALYGSSAMGGVINVITRRSAGPIGGRAAGEYGTFGTYRAQAELGGSITPDLDLDVVIAAGGRGEGYRIGRSRWVAADSVTKTLADGGTVRLPELEVDTVLAFSEYSTRSGDLRLGYSLGERWKVDASAGVFVGRGIQNPGDLLADRSFYDPRTLNELDRNSAEIGLRGDLDGHELLTRVFSAREQTAYYDDPLQPAYISFRSPTRWLGAQVQDVISLGAHSVTAGVDLLEVRLDSERFTELDVAAPPYAPASSTRSAAAFTEATLNLLDDRLVTTVGARLDRVAFGVEEGEIWDFNVWNAARVESSSETRTVLNPNLGLLYRVGSGVRLHSTAGRAFVAPDAFYVAGYAEARATDRNAVRITQGNPRLAPESSRSWDAGVGIFRPDRGLDADLTYFRTAVRNRVVQRGISPTDVQLTPAGDTILGIVTYANADRAGMSGVEGRLSYDLGATSGYDRSLRLFVNGTRLLSAEEISGGESREIRNVADLTLVAGIDYDDFRRFSGRLAGRYVGERLDQDFSDWMNPGDVRYPAFLVIDATAHLRLLRRYRVSLSVDNLTDENYYEVRGYNLPGRMARLGLTVDF